jgi:hypothetical protein
MKRRRLLLGVGGAALSSALVARTGAFTSVSADRDVEVQVANDADALLQLEPCEENGAYVTTSGGTLAVDMSSSNDQILGEGVNADATTVVDGLFRIANQGTQPVGVWLDVSPIQNGEGDPAVELYRDGDQDASVVGQGNAVCLDVGESVCVGLVARTYGLDSGVDNLFQDVANGKEMVVNADAEVACGTDTVPVSYQRAWADSASGSLATTKDGDPVSDSRDDPSSATGSPDGDFVSLGTGGELVVEFTGSNGSLVSNPNQPDLVVEEVTGGRSSYHEEEVDVEVRPPGGSFQPLGTATNKAPGGTNTFDFDGVASQVEAVRLTDVTDTSAFSGESDGFDVDAVGGWIQA